MDNVKYLFKNRLIRFEQMLLHSFLKVRLSETEYTFLVQLYNYETQVSEQLSLSEIANRTTVNVEELGEAIDLLVKKGFIELSISEETGVMEEHFSVYPTLLRVLEEENKPIIVVEHDKMAELLERELERPLSAKELQIIKTWNYTLDQVKEALLQALKQQVLSIPYIDKILENTEKEVVKDLSYFDQFLNE